MASSPDAEVGLRIKMRRQEAGLSLRELAGRTDLTASFLSQLERGRVSVSLGSLRRIAEGLGVQLLYFLQDENGAAQHDNGAPEYSPVVRAFQRRKLTLPNSQVTYEMLVPDFSGKMEAFYGRLAPGTGNVARRLREPTEEFIHILSGVLKVGLVSGEYVLHPGDSIYFDGAAIVELSCASDDEVLWLSVITPPLF
ncbi:MAG: helix-turn-helix transcriptional regulator [Anaerolineales bacterium]|nr:helix-turn-helix transcriptional regulator [Anaerolineales bacterium]